MGGDSKETGEGKARVHSMLRSGRLEASDDGDGSECKVWL